MDEIVDIPTAAGSVHAVITGSGPPVLLLHGMPETHLMWREIVPELARGRTVITTDLRAHGASAAPDPARTDYSMRSLAGEQHEAMQALGFDAYAVIGHDRGGRCGYRLAVDHPDAVTHLGVIDIVPTGDAYERADWRLADGFWVWSFLAAGETAVKMITAAPEAFVDHLLTAWPDPGFTFPAEVRSAYLAQFRDPARVRGMTAQYRAAVEVDRPLDLADRGRRPIHCPVQVLWSVGGPVDQWYDPVQVWRAWAADVSGTALPGGHFLPEENPAGVLAELLPFLSRRRASAPPAPPGPPG